MNRILILAISFSLCVFAAVRGNEAMYVGGTLSVPEKTEGKLETTDATNAKFASKKGEFLIPYAKIESIEYGQKVGRRVGAAVAVSPVLLLSKKRKHFVTVAYQDAQNVKQSAVFELSKGSLFPIVSTLEKNSGKKATFESEDAKKNYENEAK